MKLKTNSDTDASLRPGWNRWVLAAVCVVLGFYCCHLNWTLHQHTSPFFDSLSYNEQLFRVMTVSRESGLAAGLNVACFENSTNCLPFAIAAIAAPLVEPSRMVGVWILTGFLLLMLLSLDCYLRRIVRLRPAIALAGSLAFLAIHALFRDNGGLSDFRMDLLLYFTFGTTCLWYLISMAKPSKRHFVLLGIAAAVCCLSRATAPVYLLVTLVPLSLFDLGVGSDRLVKLKGLLIAAGLVAVLAGWFFVLNFDYLKYYYVDWNVDANARLPFSKAALHFKLVFSSVGVPLWLAMVGCSIAINVVRKDLAGAKRFWREYDWRIGWIAVAPILMLVVRGAGLNKFVSLPGVFGCVLFFVCPIAFQVDQLSNRKLSLFCGSLLLVVIGVAVAEGWIHHAPDGFNSTRAQNQLIEHVLEDARADGRADLTLGVTYLGKLNTCSLSAGLLFDFPGAAGHLDGVTVGSPDIQCDIRCNTLFDIAAPATWNGVSGETDAEKLAWLLEEADRTIDYLIVPDSDTAQRTQSQHALNCINQHAVSLREQVLANPGWVKIGPTVQVSEQENVEIFRKTRPTASSGE